MNEIWKPIKGYEGLYEISNYGNVKSLRYHNGTQTRLLKPRVNKYGYLQVGLYLPKQKQPKTFTIHRLVATSFLDNKYNYNQVNHIDGNKTNNHVQNLEWCNSMLNNQHRVYILKKSGFPLGKQVKCIETGEIYPSIRKAELQYKCCGLSKLLRGEKGHYTYAGLHWKLI